MSTELKYVEMCTRNLGHKGDCLADDEVVLVFDMDHCLYYCPELGHYENQRVKNTFLDISKLTEKEWNEHQSSYNLYREIFYHLFSMAPIDFVKQYEMPEIEKFLNPDLELRSILNEIKLKKYVFTNSCKYRTSYFLNYLNLEDCFEKIICADNEDTEFICKPMPSSYEFVENVTGISNRSNIYFFDDSSKNIAGAKQRGWNTVTVEGPLKNYLSEFIQK